MKLRAEDFMDVVDEGELYKIKADLVSGGVILKKLVDEKLKALEHKKRKSCTVCGENLLEIDKNFSLIFGPDDFKKKASFCAMDCLEYFLAELKKVKQVRK